MKKGCGNDRLWTEWKPQTGFHAVHEEWKRRGAAPAFVSALTGVAGAAAIQRGAEALFR